MMPEEVEEWAWEYALRWAWKGDLTTELIARAVMAAVAEERSRWHPAVIYFDRYCQDEADDVENCVCGPQQHEEAKAFAAIIRQGQG